MGSFLPRVNSKRRASRGNRPARLWSRGKLINTIKKDGYTSTLTTYLFSCRELAGSPYINRFLQPDSIIPDLINPQSWNRFSYVQNNPIRYTDPTGHLLLENEGGGGCSTSGYCAGNNSSSVSIGDGGSGSLGGNANTDFDHTSPMPVPIENNFVSNYCGESSFFGCTSMFMQDSASMIDLVGMGVVSTFTITGCVVGVPGGGEGILAGCIAGGIEGLLFYNLSGLNTAEFILSAGSTMFTLLDDYLDDGEIGEASNTSITATMVGAVMVDPFTDALIDGYVSGYNHGIFNGIVDLYNGFPIIVVR